MPYSVKEARLAYDIFMCLREKLIKPVSTTDILKQFPVSYTTALKVYKKVFKKTPHHHRELLKMELAKRLIHKGYPLKAVAMELGYQDPANFIKMFKRITQQPPSWYFPKQ